MEAEVAAGPEPKLHTEAIGVDPVEICADTIIKPYCNYQWEVGDLVSLKVRSELNFSNDHEHSYLNLHLRFVDPLDNSKSPNSLIMPEQ